MSLTDANERRRIAGDLDTTLVVEAAAGTGKTEALVQRMVALICEGKAQLHRMVAVTFTDAAGGEIKLRLRSALEAAKAHASPSAREHVGRALAALEAAPIGTIHALCGDLLRRYAVEAGVDPAFQIAPGAAARGLLQRALDPWLAEVSSAPPPGVARFLRRRSLRGGDTPSQLLLDLVRRKAERRHFPAPWPAPEVDRRARLLEVLGVLRELAPLAPARRPDDKRWLHINLWEIAQGIKGLDEHDDLDHLEARLCRLATFKTWTYRGSNGEYSPGLSCAEVRERRDRAYAALQDLVGALDAELAAALDAELQPVIAAYEHIKARRGCLDFQDLLLKARDLLRDNPQVRTELLRDVTHVLVDEMQDTDPVQTEIVLLLTAQDPTARRWQDTRPRAGGLFMVGDPKQSVYRFRRADLQYYRQVTEHLVQTGAVHLHLTSSFRAPARLQTLINRSFAPLMDPARHPSQAAYVPLSPVREDDPSQPAVVVLPLPTEYDYHGSPKRFGLDRHAPNAVAAFLHFLLHRSGWTVTEGNTRVPVQSRHVCLLMRRLRSYDRDLTAPYRQALNEHDIPHVLLGGRSYFEREEILALEVVLRAIERPQDTLHVYGALRGMFMGLGDDALLAFKHQQRHLHPLRSIDPDTLDDLTRPVAEALELLRTLHQLRNRRPFTATVDHFLREVRAAAGLAMLEGGEQALANVTRLIEIAREYEASGGLSWRGLLEHMRQEREAAATAEAEALEQTAEGVRIMTVHHAKGLELPVVVLCDPEATFEPHQLSHWADPEQSSWFEPMAGLIPQPLRENLSTVKQLDEEEAVRLCYVAATRARDLLVTLGTQDAGSQRELDNWCRPLASVLGEARCNREVAQAVGLHVFTPELDARNPATGFRGTALLAPDGDDPVDPQPWLEERTRRLASGATPSQRVLRATNPTHHEHLPPAARNILVHSADVALPSSTQRHRHFARLVRELARASVHATAGLGTAARSLRRRLSVTPPDIDAAAIALQALQAHPLWQRALASHELRWDLALAWQSPDGTRWEGRVDVAWREASGWWVVALRSADQRHEPRPHEDGLRMLAFMLQEIWDEPAQPTLVWI